MNPEEKALAKLRKEIDAIDYHIHDLINERAKLALTSAEIKIKYHGADANFYHPEREKIVIQQIKDYNRGPLDEQAVARIFESIILECRNLQFTTHKKNHD